MAFLFKSKKNAEKAQATRDIAGSQASNARMNEKGAVQASTPGSSVNNSITSLQGGGGNATPSPEQVNGGRRAPVSNPEPSQDLPVSCCSSSRKRMDNARPLVVK